MNEPPEVDAVLAALQALYHDPNPSAKQQANEALQRFQKTPQAWTTANTLLLEQDLPLESRLFAAQTFRSKVTFDLEQLPSQTLVQLRDTLLHALDLYTSGPRVVQTQLCLALAALALQMPESSWGTVIPGMVERFGGTPATVGTLLEFLTVLPEEVTNNHRIPLDNARYHERVPQLLTQHTPTVLQVLVMYMQADGVTPAIQSTVFACLRSWLKAGEVAATQLADTPLVACAFDALTSDELFDVAVDVLCDLINETQEIDDNQPVIEYILPRIQALRGALADAGDDEDRVRGLCRVVVQAGETYHTLCLQHADAMLPIVYAILDCASYHDLDIVQITFRFWYLLATDVHRAAEHGTGTTAPFERVYEQLFAVILRHLRFPDDEEALTGQERDDFRSFRHYMGDTLKDCCYVLGAERCIERSLQLIESALTQESPELRWQDMEAPLFSMRSMGGQVSLRDSTVIPRVFAALPHLPPHPRLRYAALLVVSRYTEWVAEHSDLVSEVWAFIAAGFQGADRDISAAAAQALNFLCQDCRESLLPLFPQLLDFYGSVKKELAVDDLLAVVEALTHVVTAMPSAEAAQSLLIMAQPLLEEVHEVSALSAATKPDLMRAADRMEQLTRMLQVIGVTLASTLPQACEQTCAEAYAILDRLLERHGHVYFISERASALVRRALIFFGDRAQGVLPQVLERFATCYEATGFSGYVWIVGKSIDQFGHSGAEPLLAQMAHAFARITIKTHALLDEVPNPDALSDVLDDYLHTCLVTLSAAPALLYMSPVAAQAYLLALRALAALSPGVVGIAADVVRAIIECAHEVPPLERVLVDAAHDVVGKHGAETCVALLTGLVTHFPPENMPIVVSSMCTLAANHPSEVVAWVSNALEHVPLDAVPASDRSFFLDSIRSAPSDRMKPSLLLLYSASRKSRERGM
ncbi:Nuclear import receptor [Malassezia equina]|uniref:Nuclear import receptor n=1 Tax=Malassezia equina TaxID=1381935 RepID=A0AAF0EIP0_9BASI|nr:Nuclear import receptor [Malassezia equina]